MVWITLIALGAIGLIVLFNYRGGRKPVETTATAQQRARTAGPAPKRAPALKKVAEDFVAIDTETTGLTDEDRVITFAAAHVKGGEVQAVMHLCFNPGRKSSPQAARVHGWRDDDLAVQPLIDDHVNEIADFLRRAPVLIAHNMKFDARMMRAAHPKLNHAISEARTACSLRFSQARLPTGNHELDTCLQHYGLKRASGVHNALEDVVLVASLVRCLAEKGPIDLPALSHVPTNIVLPLPSGRTV